jgi:hypothetical protein
MEAVNGEVRTGSPSFFHSMRTLLLKMSLILVNSMVRVLKCVFSLVDCVKM